MKLNKDKIQNPKEVLQFLALYAGKVLPTDAWTLAAMNIYCKLMKSKNREFLVLDYQGIEATFGITKDEITKSFEKRSWQAPKLNEKAADDAVTHFLENNLTPEHVIETKQGYRYNYTKIALDIALTLSKVAPRRQMKEAYKPKASELALGSVSHLSTKILEMFQDLDYDRQVELLKTLEQTVQEPVDVPDTLD